MSRSLAVVLFILLALAFLAPYFPGGADGPKCIGLIKESEQDTPHLANLESKLRALVDEHNNDDEDGEKEWTFKILDEDNIRTEPWKSFAAISTERPILVVGDNEAPRESTGVPTDDASDERAQELFKWIGDN